MSLCVVTGGSRGLGLEIVKSILQADSVTRILVLNRRLTDDLERIIEKSNGRVFFHQLDLSNPEAIREVYLNVIKPSGPVKFVVHNAAVAYDDLISNINISALDSMYKVNVLTPMLLTKYCIRDMVLHRKPGSIVFISSVSAHTGYKGLAMYASTKGAIEAFSKNLAREWGSLGIRSNCVVPGFMSTDMSSALSDDLKNKIYARTALRKETAKESVAETVAFLLSDSSASISGQNIHVDCGTI